MERTLAKDAINKISKQVFLKGWIKTRRDHGKLIFLDLYDRSGLVQMIVNPKVSNYAYNIAQEIKTEFVVEVVGKVNKRPTNAVNKNLKTGTVEIEISKINILSKAEALPFDMGGEDLILELPTLLDHRPLTLRHLKIKSIFEVQEAIAQSFREAAQRLDCTEIFVPTISASATEGGADVFSINYYDHKAYLTQSPQLYKQMMVPVFERVFTIAKAYRAEPSVTTRHLCEVTQMDCEFGFSDFEMLLDLLEDVGRQTLNGAIEKSQDLLKLFNIEKPKIDAKIPRLTLREAQEIIFKEKGRNNRNEADLSPQDEIDLGEWVGQEFGSDLITITHFPTKKRAFYTMPDPKNKEFSLSYDLLFKGSEIASGSQRINDYSMLVKTIKERRLDPKNFGMYLMAFKYGMPQEGGFSFGLERMTMKLLNLPNIREASLYPRDMERVDERFSAFDSKDKK